MKKILTILAAILLVLTSCEMELPDPIIGTYILTAEEDSSLFECGFSFSADNTFKYYEVVSKGQSQMVMTGTYSVELNAFNFVNANGFLTLKVTDMQIPDDIMIGDTYLDMGTNAFMFDWTCDRNNGPQGMTLVKNVNVSDENLELKYVGGPDKLSSFI